MSYFGTFQTTSNQKTAVHRVERCIPTMTMPNAASYWKDNTCWHFAEQKALLVVPLSALTSLPNYLVKLCSNVSDMVPIEVELQGGGSTNSPCASKEAISLNLTKKSLSILTCNDEYNVLFGNFEFAKPQPFEVNAL